MQYHDCLYFLNVFFDFFYYCRAELRQEIAIKRIGVKPHVHTCQFVDHLHNTVTTDVFLERTAKIQITDSDGNPIDDAYILDLYNYITPNVAMFIYLDGTVLTNQDILPCGGHINLGFDICFK